TIELTNDKLDYSAALKVTAGTLVNAPGGVIAVLGGSEVVPRTLGAQLDNQGTLLVDAVLTLSKPGVQHTSSGAINVSGGHLTAPQSGASASFTNSGTVTVAAGRTAALSGGTYTQDAPGTVGGPGTLALTGVTAAFHTPVSVAALDLVSSTASYPADLST